eukprot:CAMPEP_0173142318 /NCGR_PEP_ID=MMETSP1105-20130129/6021_1 /TAXON_ID=2985 /ORGANISM="Ochromonas sp., Strain BG-1" /LENGTH=996 /DNA_ID=CAMNT_0014055695 /DNA_START=91 /DNA_END=3081 /DNA_ORIENTATION=-
MSQLKKYRKVKYLGKGSYGAAILVELRADPIQKFVIKEIVIGHLKPQEQQSAKNEAEVLHQMNHSNITSYIESFVENSKLYIVMEHADGGDLTSAIQKKKTEGKYWHEDEIMRIFVQICLALKHVHNANILHRDLKSQNIFLTQKGMVKLGDFGIAKVLDATDDQARTQIGTPYYLSPEICESKPYGRKSDVWSLGVVLYELLALEMPFQANSLPALVHRICSAEPSYSKLESRYSNTLVSLCKSLLLKNPDQRPEVSQIVRTDFIKDHISRLLSFTLKSGTGGAPALPEAPQSRVSIDPDEADDKIERLRGKEKEAQSKGEKSEDAREKVRKIRQEMMNNQQQPRNRKPGEEMKVYEGKEADNYVQQRGAVPSTNNNRALSPKSAIAAARAGAAGGGGGARQVSEAPRVNPFQRQNSNQPSNVVVGGGAAAGGGRVKSLAEIQAERQQTSNYESNSEYARREYFERRAAAQAVKMRVESYERGGYDPGNAVALRQGGRRPSDSEYSTNNHNHPSDNDNLVGLNPEQRIAMLKAQREKEKEREIAEKERQMKQAIEQQREERRRSEANQKPKAIAFDIDINSDRVEAKNVKVRDVPVAAPVNDVGSADQKYSKHQRKPSNTEETNSNQNRPVKKGWGPPVEASEIFQARGIQPPSNIDKTPPSQRYGNRRDGDAKEGNSNSNSDVEDFGSNDFLAVGNERGEEEEDNREILKRIEYKRRSQLEVRQQAREVLTKLREQRQLQVKNRRSQPREVSPMRRREAENLSVVGESRSGRRSPMRSRAEIEAREKANAAAPVSASGKERRPSGTESKLVSASEDRSRSNSRSRGGDSARDEPTPVANNLSLVVEEMADDLQDTLSNWLEEQKRAVTVRRKKPASPVPGRRNEAKEALLKEEDESFDALAVNEDDDVHLYKSLVTDRNQRHYQHSRGNRDDSKSYDDSEAVEEDLLSPAYQEDVISPYYDRPLKGKFIDGDDVEVVGMQCMLAKALMGDDDDN